MYDIIIDYYVFGAAKNTYTSFQLTRANIGGGLHLSVSPESNWEGGSVVSATEQFS